MTFSACIRATFSSPSPVFVAKCKFNLLHLAFIVRCEKRKGHFDKGKGLDQRTYALGGIVILRVRILSVFLGQNGQTPLERRLGALLPDSQLPDSPCSQPPTQVAPLWGGAATVDGPEIAPGYTPEKEKKERILPPKKVDLKVKKCCLKKKTLLPRNCA